MSEGIQIAFFFFLSPETLFRRFRSEISFSIRDKRLKIIIVIILSIFKLRLSFSDSFLEAPSFKLCHALSHWGLFYLPENNCFTNTATLGWSIQSLLRAIGLASTLLFLLSVLSTLVITMSSFHSISSDLFVSMSVCLSVCLSVSLSLSLPLPLSLSLSLSLSSASPSLSSLSIPLSLSLSLSHVVDNIDGWWFLKEKIYNISFWVLQETCMLWALYTLL